MANRPFHWTLVVGLAWMTLASQTTGQDALDQFAYRARDLDALRSGFDQPPRETGPWVHWFWFDGMLSEAEIAREINELADAGFAGAEIRCITFHGWSGDPLPQTDPEDLARIGHRRVEYLSDEFIDLLAHACAEAKRRGMRLSINMGQGWPPGGPWIPDEHRTKLLTTTAVVVDGPDPFITSDLPERGYVLAWKCDSHPRCVEPDSLIDLASQIEISDGRRVLRWEAPPGKWLVGLFEVVPGGICDKGDGPEVDPASRKAVLFHLEHFFGRVDPKLQRYYGDVLVDVASDSWEYHHGSARYWSEALPGAVAELTGYDLRKRMHALLGYGPGVADVLADLKQAEQTLVEQNFFQTVADFLRTRNLGHRPQVYGRGLARNFFIAYASAATPEVEQGILVPEAPWAAFLTGKPVVSAEAFTFLSDKHAPVRHRNAAWETTPALLRWHANHYYAEGVNRIQFHSYSYSPPDLPPPGWRMYAEIHFNGTLPWWDWTSELTRWMARNQWILQSGRPIADTLVYPVTPNAGEGPFGQQAIRQPVSAANGVVAADRGLMGRLRVDDRLGEIAFGNLLLLEPPDSVAEAVDLLEAVPVAGRLLSTVTLEQWERLNKSTSDPRLKRLLSQLHASNRYVRVARDQWRSALARHGSVTWTPSYGDLRYHRRRIGEADVFFLVNAGDAFDGHVTFNLAKPLVEQWDADHGHILPVASMSSGDQGTTIPIRLGHFESTIVSFASGTTTRKTSAAGEGDGARRRSTGLADSTPDGPLKGELSDSALRASPPAMRPSIKLRGSWTLSPVGASTDRSIHELEKLVSWQTLAGFERYSGQAAYETAFLVAPEAIADNLRWSLDLGRVYEVARVWVNGKPVGAAWSPPYRLDVTGALRPGRNELRVVVANLLKNRLEPGTGYHRPSGLLGPVALRPSYDKPMGQKPGD